MFSFPLYERLKAETPEFEEVTAFQAGRGRLSVRRQGIESAARPLRSEYVTGNYFSTLGVRALGGRVFTPDDDKPSATPVAVLSHRIWQTTYAADPSIVGATFVVEGHPLTVIGVAPPGFFGETLESDPPDIWVPVQQEPLDINARPVTPFAASHGFGQIFQELLQATIQSFQGLRCHALTVANTPVAFKRNLT